MYQDDDIYFYLQFLRLKQKRMQGIDDPQTFQLSQVVQKNSKSGIFTNKRLLMIKDGFLYYFSTVPAEYKYHEPNIMSSLTQFPKCSIEIKSINSIRLQSAKSSILIINFQEKDMIARQDIRNSVSSKNYLHPIKKDSSNDIEEWKFVFSSIMKCRLWYGSLVKLKQYFVKNQDKFDKFTQYMANFDPEIRNSLPYTSRNSTKTNQTAMSNSSSGAKLTWRQQSQEKPAKSINSLQKITQNSQQKNKFNKQSGIFQIQQMVDQQNIEDTTIRDKEQSKPQSPKEIQKLQQSIDKITTSKKTQTFQQKYKETILEQKHKKIILEQKSKEKQDQKEVMMQKINENEKEQSTHKKTQKEAVNQNKKEDKKQIQIKVLSPKDIFKRFQAQNIRNQTKNKSIQKQKGKKQLNNSTNFLAVTPSQSSNKSNSSKTVITTPPSVKQAKPILKPAQIQTINEQKLQEYKQKIRRQQRQKIKEEVLHFNRSIQQKQKIIKNLQGQMQYSKRQHKQLQNRIKQQQQLRLKEEARLKQQFEAQLREKRQKKQEQQYRRLTQFVNKKEQNVLDDKDVGYRSSRQIVTKEYSIQTDNDKDILQVIEQSMQQTPRNHINNRYSSKSNFSLNPSNQRQTIPLFRNTVSYISEVKIQENQDIHNYDYYLQLTKLYQASQIKDRIAKELALAQFIKKASRKVTDVVTNYIDSNKPKQSIKIDRSIFQIEIVCDRGKIIRTEGDEQLIYQNENHQRLKRYFKIYNYLNQIIIKILKKKPNFPLRVPYACFVQYKGYSVLARIMPNLKPNSINNNYLKYLGADVPIHHLALYDFQHHSTLYSLIQPTLPFKITKQDESALLRLPQKNYDFLTLNRRANISLQASKLYEQSKQIQNNAKERLKYAQMISFCRQMKKIMRANTPYLDELCQFQYFDDFLQEPSIFMKQTFKKSNQKIDGMLLHFIQRIVGIKLKTKFTKNNYFYYAIPLKRQFTLMNLDISRFTNNFQKYCTEQKYDLALKSIAYSKYLQQQYSEILTKQISLHIYKSEFTIALQKIQLNLQILSYHDPKRLQMLELKSKCYQTQNNSILAFQCLKELLEYTQYMFQQKDKLIQVYFMIAHSFSRQKLIPQQIQVYRTILQESPQNRQRILIEFSQNLLNQDTDPHIIIDFLQKEISVQEDKQSAVIQLFLGQLFYKAKNTTKALSYFISSFTQLLQQGKKDDKIYESFIKLIACTSSLKEKKEHHKKLYLKLVKTNFIYSVYCKKINTFICCKICQTMTNDERDTIINILQGNQQVQDLKLLEWSNTEEILIKLSKKYTVNFQEKQQLFASIKLNELSQFCIYLNCPQFH